MFRRLPLLLLLAAGCRPAGSAPPAVEAAKPKVKLAVLVVFDQLRGDYLTKYRGEFGPDGFARLMAQGAWFPDCHYPYAGTTTGPGHAATLTGCGGSKNGIVANNWYDRKLGQEVYCAGSERYQLVPTPAVPDDPDNLDPVGKPTRPAVVGNPDRLLSPTVADQLKAAANPGKVFALSLKDRSGIMPAGRKPDGVYWFEGRFSTSTYYRDSLPPWVNEFNRAGLAESYFGKDWTRLKPAATYDRLAGPDNGPGEGVGRKQGATFPHPTTGGAAKPGKDYYEAMANSPYGNDLLLAFTKACVAAEKLGQHDTPDLLVVSFSSNDLVGHAWGPDSHEVADITLRSDLILADLLRFLDASVGAGNYGVVVTADHGVCPNPEASAARPDGTPAQKAARRLDVQELQKGAERALAAAFGVPPAPPADPDAEAKPAAKGKKKGTGYVEMFSAPSFTLSRRALEGRATPEAAADVLAAWLRKQPGVARAYTAKELQDPAALAGDELAPPARRSFHPERSGDVVVVTREYWLYQERTKTGKLIDTGTSHGTPWGYDTHAAFLAFGPGVGGGERGEKVSPLHAAPIVADWLGVPVPRDCEVALPATLAKP